MGTATLASIRFPNSPANMSLMQLRPAADQFGVSVDLLRDLINTGELKPYRLGRRILIDPDELLALASRNAGRQA